MRHTVSPHFALTQEVAIRSGVAITLSLMWVAGQIWKSWPANYQYPRSHHQLGTFICRMRNLLDVYTGIQKSQLNQKNSQKSLELFQYTKGFKKQETMNHPSLAMSHYASHYISTTGAIVFVLALFNTNLKCNPCLTPGLL